MHTGWRSLGRGLAAIAIGVAVTAIPGIPMPPVGGALELAALLVWVALILGATTPVEDRLVSAGRAAAVVGLVGLWAATAAALVVAHLQVEWAAAALRRGPDAAPDAVGAALDWIRGGDALLAVAAAWLLPIAVGLRVVHRRRAPPGEPPRLRVGLAALDTLGTVLGAPIVMVPVGQLVERVGPLGTRCMALSLAGMVLLPAVLAAGDALGERLATSRRA